MHNQHFWICFLEQSYLHDTYNHNYCIIHVTPHNSIFHWSPLHKTTHNYKGTKSSYLILAAIPWLHLPPVDHIHWPGSQHHSQVCQVLTQLLSVHSLQLILNRPTYLILLSYKPSTTHYLSLHLLPFTAPRLHHSVKNSCLCPTMIHLALSIWSKTAGTNTIDAHSPAAAVYTILPLRYLFNSAQVRETAAPTPIIMSRY